MNALDNGFIGSEELMRKTGSTLIRNAGKIVAVMTVAAAILLTFTDIRLGSLVGNDLTGELVMMLAAAYLMYFSLEDAGERLGKETKEYEKAAADYEKARAYIGAEDVGRLRDFCIGYSERELEYRKRSALVAAGLSEVEMERWQSGERAQRRTRRTFKRVARMKAVTLTPSVLLSQNARGERSELASPERFKLARMVASLLPTTVGMCITVSVMLTMKDGLSAESVIEGLIKLVTLPIVGFRGYSSGYAHVRDHGIPWLETKTRLLRIFVKDHPSIQ